MNDPSSIYKYAMITHYSFFSWGKYGLSRENDEGLVDLRANIARPNLRESLKICVELCLFGSTWPD